MGKKNTNSTNKKNNNYLAAFCWTILSIYFLVFMARVVNFSASDLGRHLTNGKLFVEHFKVISTNFYSYTESDRPCINHHWFSGVLFYLTQQLIGFKGLSFFYILLGLASLYFFLKVSLIRSTWETTLLATLLIVPLIAYRTEIRPEGFSYLFIGVYFYLYNRFSEGKIKFKTILISTILIQIIWVNAHIFFFFGPLLILLFFIQQVYILKDETNKKQFLYLFSVSISCCIINPMGIKGMLAPINIFESYGYMVAENQSLYFMFDRFGSAIFIHTFITLIIGCACAFLLLKNKNKSHFVAIVLFVISSIFALKAVRGIALVGFTSIPLISMILNTKLRSSFFKPMAFFSLILIFYGFTQKEKSYWAPVKPETGLGLMKVVDRSAKFVLQNNLKGPIFNNYDIGGYIIYYLGDKEKVFTDNRPEAYSVLFFETIYNPILEKNEVWERYDSLYKFNYIWFYRHDNTTFGQPFLIQRIKDKNWCPVFVDDYNIILVKRTIENERIIKQFELPQSLFISTPGA